MPEPFVKINGRDLQDAVRSPERVVLVEQDTTIIMVTHDRELAGQIPRVEEVRNGQLVSSDQIDRRLVTRR